MNGQVQTVLGPMAPADMGTTITHESTLVACVRPVSLPDTCVR